ncbi:MAG: type II toxin-antitoxin system PemK/MazF family toxin [Treponema sp.]|uniref:type II toxin-antitoxin system PemK/MazF family toxin n=1 Tax=Treponema sp. TaxID=166 RepID=UPI002A91EDA3|nr:type II toxin-antitoxin system PemK/MazF family toxin [Treponema sp.]MDY6398143.1 type II toxin-antitoxin system PemK/MazF family toxin [Treponema sp.]
MTRGEIWWVDFGLAFGSMTMGRRPALVVQNDNFNASKIATTVVLLWITPYWVQLPLSCRLQSVFFIERFFTLLPHTALRILLASL